MGKPGLGLFLLILGINEQQVTVTHFAFPVKTVTVTLKWLINTLPHSKTEITGRPGFNFNDVPGIGVVSGSSGTVDTMLVGEAGKISCVIAPVAFLNKIR